VIIPAFSLGRTQQVVYFLNELVNSGELPRVPVYVDSPLSYKVTQVYRYSAKEILDEHVQETLRTDEDPFHFEGLTYVRTQEESIALNRLSGPMVIIAASGMCESGRVLHHLKHAVGEPQNTIVIIGFQAENTLGRRIVEKQSRLRIYDRHYPLRANVEILNGLSAHADAEDFKWWLAHMGSTTGIGQAFLVHGEDKARTALTSLIRDYCDEDAISPRLYESFDV
jgi:metallo-beta-lactamase family protein